MIWTCADWIVLATACLSGASEYKEHVGAVMTAVNEVAAITAVSGSHIDGV